MFNRIAAAASLLLLLVTGAAAAVEAEPAAAAAAAGGRACADAARELQAGQTRWGDAICISRQAVRCVITSCTAGPPHPAHQLDGCQPALPPATRYRLLGLRPSTPYEVRVSYPANVSPGWEVQGCAVWLFGQ